MTIESKYSAGRAPNSLQILDDKCLLQVLRLSCAANDLLSNHEAIQSFPDNEVGYFFYNSIAIVREVAKLVSEMSDNNLIDESSTDVREEYEELHSYLAHYGDDSLTKKVLKPIRDTNFHYKFEVERGDKRLQKLLSEIRNQNELSVAIDKSRNHLMTMRYSFADRFRTEFINSYLSDDYVQVISEVAVKLASFVDSLLADLIERHEKVNIKNT